MVACFTLRLSVLFFLLEFLVAAGASDLYVSTKMIPVLFFVVCLYIKNFFIYIQQSMYVLFGICTFFA